MTTLLLPSSMSDSPTVPADVRVVRYDISEPLPDDVLDAEALVVWGNGHRQMADAARRLTRLRWVQTLAAGPDSALAAGFAPEVVITSGRGLHDGPVAEHTLALLLAAARRLPECVRAQDQHRWAHELGGVQEFRPGLEFRSLAGSRVLVWGFGSIAARLAPMLTALGADVQGVARSAGDRHGYPVISTFDLPDALPRADVLVSLLPATPQNERVIDGAVFDLLPDHAFVVNVGRGSVLDETALLTAIRDGRIAGAALDVFDTEPLPADSPLWAEPRILVTPHAAGGRPLGAGALVSENLVALLSGGDLRNVVPRS
ncbi:NAD(P)-dependent oxidoreductase [Cellulomonas sp. URHE0023]|uniref:NAD(P)-dependent oxidoreductase n=1 Tax=Cellulomonas sp. URHE0023 TaxID=1380354 RepID=UPI0004896312|nr:NAD(P)-dependent oxidoreductase [Cellulomonas sp. URHE0023]